LPFGNTYLQLVLVPPAFIVLHQFLVGKLLIRYDRSLWFLGVVLAITCSLMLNFQNTMLTGFFLFMFSYSLLVFSRSSTSATYVKTLQAFQFLVALISCIAVAQFVAQFVVDGKQLIFFFGLVPDALLEFGRSGGWTTVRELGNGLIKSNGIFLTEPSALSQMTALGILIEVLEFRRWRYLFVLALGFLVAYSGTGLMLLLFFLPLSGLHHGKAGLAAMVVGAFTLALLATGIIDPAVFLSRVGEFQDTRASGFSRFVAPVWLAADEFDSATLQTLLLGNGPGTAKIIAAETASASGYGGYVSPWFKLFYEYGIIGSFVIGCFVVSCVRKSRCPRIVTAAIIFTWLFLAGNVAIIMMVLCTLNGPEPQRRRIDESISQNRSPLAAGA
jgi:hypothetical protein